MPASLPDALLDPCAYPDRPAAVELRETHISWVFLAGRRAYKVKKPIVFSFVDYGTLERRRAACHEEIRLNRRFAAGIYAGIVALVPRGPHGLAIAQEYDPRAVEYAVEMRRYDERATLAARLAAAAVSEADAVLVGAAVARWHAAAPRDPDAAAGRRRLAAVSDETLATLRASGAVPARRLAGIERFCRAALTGVAEELWRRARAGAVRDGHGDLRAEHILVGPPIAAVDGLEFDRELRVADVAYDLAFLVMDVARRDDGLARAVVRGYAEAGGDAGSRRLLCFMCALRALVRAKVDVLRAAQLDGPAAAERRERATELLALADRFAWDGRLPPITCVAGLAASGKSTVAAMLARASGRSVVSSDRLRKARAGIPATARAPASAYADRESTAVYTELGRHAAAAAGRDGGVLVDATFRRERDAAAFAAGLARAGPASWLICRAPPSVLLERARRRALRPDTTSDADPSVVAAQIAAAAEAPPWRGPVVSELDTTRSPRQLLDGLARELDAALAGEQARASTEPAGARRRIPSRPPRA